MSDRVTRFNTEIDDDYGRGDHHVPATTGVSQRSDRSQKSGGCPVFGHHPADAHRESEIVGGAFGH